MATAPEPSGNPLLKAPPRLSDLHGDERKAAMLARDEARKADWLYFREPRTRLERLAARLADKIRGTV